MSGFIISTETMQRVVNAIDTQHRGAFCGMSTTDSACLDAIGAALFALNTTAVNDRYSGPEQIAPRFRYRPLGTIPLHEQFAALSCLLYQCAEGSVPETTTYKALDTLRNAIACKIAHDLAARNKTPWDWSER